MITFFDSFFDSLPIVIYGLMTSQLAFWLLVNLLAYMLYRFAIHAVLSSPSFALLMTFLPVSAGVATILWADPWWLGSIGVLFLVLTLLPLLLDIWDRIR